MQFSDRGKSISTVLFQKLKQKLSNIKSSDNFSLTKKSGEPNPIQALDNSKNKQKSGWSKFFHKFSETKSRKGSILKFIGTVFIKAFKALGPVEKKIAIAFLAIAIFSASGAAYGFWMRHTSPAPAQGGTLTEGIIGAPQYINPILAQANEADLDLSKLIFSSLFTINPDGSLKQDLAKEYSISEDKKSYTIKIKENVFWQEPEQQFSLPGKKEKLTSDDIIFTVKAIQNPSYKSPLRANLTGIDVEKIDDNTIKFSLKTPYEPFLQSLTFGILPGYIWQYISPNDTPLAHYNTKPIGSGPYKLINIAKDKMGSVIIIELTINDNYYEKSPNIEKIIFKFFKDQASLVDAINKNQIDATAYLETEAAKQIKNSGFASYTLKTPRYFSIFFNQEKSKTLADKNIRLSLNYITDKNSLISSAIEKSGEKIETPIPPTLKESAQETKFYKFDPSYGAGILTNSGWVLQDDKFRAKAIMEKTKDKKTGKTTETIKEKIPLEITLTTGDSPEFKKIAETLQAQWQAGGVKVNLNFLKNADVQTTIKNRDYEALLFGEILNLDPDPFIFWHSSETRDPGLNLALYNNRDVDKLLEDARQEFDLEKRKEMLIKFQIEVVDDAPAVFLFSPFFSYWMRTDIKGIGDQNSQTSKIITMPADRFSGIENWYIATKRVWGK